MCGLFRRLNLARKTFMHELPITENILDIVCRHAESSHVRQVVSITLEIGELSDLEDEWMQHYFDYLSKGTIAQGAKLRIIKIPITLTCNSCGNNFDIEKSMIGRSICPSCQAEGNFSIISGRQYHIKEMEAR
jgi:hydrogenase nickel incorporation protein HypA/HybF